MTEELAKTANFNLAIATAESTPIELVEALQETLGGRLRPYDLQRIVWPSGKATTWEIPTLGGETKPAKEIIALPVLAQVTRQFWGAKNSSGENTPPDCKSDDGVHGVPTEQGKELGATGACETCPLAQWGKNNTPPLCKERRELFLLMEGEYFPVVLSLPPSSIKVWRNYVKPLSLQGIAFWTAITRFKLVTATNPSGDPYAQLKVEYVGRVTPEHKERLRQYRETLTATFRAGLEAARQERSGGVAAARIAAPEPQREVTNTSKVRPVFNEFGEDMPLED